MQDDERPTREEARLHVLLVGGAPHVVFKLWLHFIAAKVQFRGASFIARLDQGLALICLVFAAAGFPFVAAFDPLGGILFEGVFSFCHLLGGRRGGGGLRARTENGDEYAWSW